MLPTRFLSRRLVNTQTIKSIATSQSRYLTTPTADKSKEEQPKPEKYGIFRSAPVALGVQDPPVVDHNNWVQRKKQKLRDFVDYEKAFAAHAAERRYL